MAIPRGLVVVMLLPAARHAQRLDRSLLLEEAANQATFESPLGAMFASLGCNAHFIRRKMSIPVHLDAPEQSLRHRNPSK